MNIDIILQFTTVISGAIMMLLVLLQQRGATLGAGRDWVSGGVSSCTLIADFTSVRSCASVIGFCR